MDDLQFNSDLIQRYTSGKSFMKTGSVVFMQSC